MDWTKELMYSRICVISFVLKRIISYKWTIKNGHTLFPTWEILYVLNILNVNSNLYTLLLQLNSYDHHAAIYLLLLDRLRHRSQSHEAPSIPHRYQHHSSNGSIDTQRRRPSSIAEQAMRKLGITNIQHYSNQHGHVQRSESPASPRHTLSTATLAPSHSPDCTNCVDLNISPRSSPSQAVLSQSRATISAVPLLPPRESNILESIMLPTKLRDFRGSTLTNSTVTSSTILMRPDRTECSSPYSIAAANLGQYGSMLSTCDSGCQKSRENCAAALGMAIRSPSNRFLNNGLDQRIIKQSTEDCRRLLQQVNYIYIFCISKKPIFKYWILYIQGHRRRGSSSNAIDQQQPRSEPNNVRCSNDQYANHTSASNRTIPV